MPLHTIQVTSPTISYQTYSRILKRLFALTQQGAYRVTYKTNTSIGFQKADCPGILINLVAQDNLAYFILRLNPSVLFGRGYDALCTFDETSLFQLEEMVNNLLAEINCPKELSFSTLFLNRVDCTSDIQFPYSNGISEFIHCIQRTKVPRDYQVVRYHRDAPNAEERNRHSFRIQCEDISLTLYDKSFQLSSEGLMPEDEIPQNRLRAEAAFSGHAFPRLFYEAGEQPTQSIQKKLLWFSDRSNDLLHRYFGQKMMPGRFLRGDLALQKIQASPFSGKLKGRMETFLYEVSRCHRNGVSKALSQMSKDGLSRDQIHHMLEAFRKLDLNPVTIRGNSGFLEFPSLQQIIQPNV